ncbi:MAG: glycosyltransferase family 2 protein [Bdellovibrionales bacterium]|nr:glycosyltransferase family 2 protein [Bdellovibrionales bacterium]
MRDFSVIVPTWNMGRFLAPLFESIVNSDLRDQIEEVIFVCEKSSDGSEKVIEALQLRQGKNLPRVKMIQPEARRGNFMARYLGAKAALTKKILLIDSRVQLPVASANALAKLMHKYPAMNSNLDIDIDKNIYCLYWQRSHESIFRTAYEARRGEYTITAENFTQHVVGTTCMYCSRDHFVSLCEDYLKAGPLFSDDTFLLADLVKREPISMHPDFRILWEPRDHAKAFLKHLYMRGPGLVQYRFFRQPGPLLYLTILGTFFLLAIAVLLFISPVLSLGILACGVLTLMLSTAFIVKSVGEFFRLAPLHAGVIIAYGLGALRGVWIVWRASGFTVPKAMEPNPQK